MLPMPAQRALSDPGEGQTAEWGQPGMFRTGRLTTFPDRMHEVQALRRLGEPSTRARTRWMLGSQRRLVLRWEWLMFIPNDGFLPQTSHTAAMTLRLPLRILWVRRKG
jgi:hypothetical protein